MSLFIDCLGRITEEDMKYWYRNYLKLYRNGNFGNDTKMNFNQYNSFIRIKLWTFRICIYGMIGVGSMLVLSLFGVI